MLARLSLIQKKNNIAINLGKQQELDADPKAIQQITFTENLDRPGNAMFFILEEEKETILDFS